MKLATFQYQQRTLTGVALDDGHLLALDSLPCAGSLQSLIDAGAAGLAAVQALLAAPPAAVQPIPVTEVTWLPPLPNPGKICGVAMNNSASNARKISAPEHPAFFLKPPSSLAAHGQAVVIREYYGSVHPEPELACVIGRTARDVAPEKALEHVFGYSIFDDITGNGMRAEDCFHYYALYARPDDPSGLQRVEQHLSYAARYKGSDTFSVMGPWLVTAADVPDPDNLDVVCRVGGELVAEDSTRYYNFKVAEVLSFISHFLTLHPGDVIALGTAFKPSATRKSIHHANLQTVAGPIEIDISGLGRQVSPVERRKGALGRWRLTRNA
jgi:2,4-diketo-3-deoxy-L-fuconate hydrolase